ncbi:hypothetical protein IPH92_03380 [Candidatus Kaiserbacteria bacterium]|nr:MAG: hypothetical protein IPH92_03380 [Candidatus Kaiserbacteria bacterium]
MGFEGLNKPIKNTIETDKYGNPEKGEQLLEQDVASCRDFRDLIVNVIDRYDDWKYSDGEPMDKEQLKEIINSVRLGERGVETVTRRYGLRSKVTELLNQLITNIEEPAKIESKEEDLTSPENQAKLAQEYLDAYADYREIADRRSNDLRILDKLRDEAVSPESIAEQEALFASTHDAEEMAMKKYVEIGKKLTEQTKNEYLR